MKILWLYFILHTVFADNNFGSYYSKDSKLCHQWNCINMRLGLPDGLPLKEQFANILSNLLPEGSWQDAVRSVLDVCYGDRPRKYTNTCPGQALMHCVVDQLIQNCPDESLRRDDACAPVSTLAGFKYMFSQSRYENLEKNLASERRPSWFLKNYFSSKCCELPQLFSRTLLAECGFIDIVNYYTHEPRPDNAVPLSYQRHEITTRRRLEKDNIKVVDISLIKEATPKPIDKDVPKQIDLSESYKLVDPIDCCDLSEFIQPSWRSECDFQLTWNGQQRLVIKNITASVSTVPPPTTARPLFNDVKVVPLSCEKETCVFRKLNIVSESGTVDTDAFSKLLDNMTSFHEEWTRAKGRVVTNCLARSARKHDEECEINRVLTCTFDVLSENCPHVVKNDPCRRSNSLKNITTCQISASKYRPKNRRHYCGLPSLVNHEVLAECGLESLNRIEHVPESATRKPWKYSWWATHKHNKCKESTDSTKCIMNKMGVMNKYGFMDYFKMKDRIRHFTNDKPAWSHFTNLYVSSFTGMTMYRDHCSSSKKLLNVVDSMLITCPFSKRKQTQQCKKLFADIANTPATPSTNQKPSHIWKHYHHIYLPYNGTTFHHVRPTTTPKPRNHKKYDNSYLNANSIPEVKTMGIKSQSLSKPLVLLPVYLRTNGKGQGNLFVRPYTDGVFRGDPFGSNQNRATPPPTQSYVIKYLTNGEENRKNRT